MSATAAERAAWHAAFISIVQRLRPHLSDRFAATLANIQYREGIDPVAAAEAYHLRQLDQVSPVPRPSNPD
jgi:hypothetical protein